MTSRTTARELLCALLIALALAAVPIGRALVDPSRVFFALDAATSQAPWSESESVQNADLAEQGLALYPAYRWTVERLCRGEIPTWNPDLEAGVPWLANPKWGVLDPQVLGLAVLEKLGGQPLFDRGFAWLAWLRLAAAGFGAYVLARRLGLAPLGASLTAVGFAGSGSILPWLGAGIGHVAPLLPWILIALERLSTQTSFRAVALVALPTALMILGGDPESAFFCGLAALVWTASTLRGGAQWRGIAGLALGVLLAAPVLVPFIEYLQHSSVLAARSSEPAGRFDFLSLGLVAILGTLVVAWRGIDNTRERASGSLAGALGIVLALATCALVVAGRTTNEAGRTLVIYDALGSHSREMFHAPWIGPGAYIDATVAWMPTVVLTLALASFFATSGPLHVRNVVQTIAFIALLLAIGAPGIADVWQRVPFFGHGSAARAAAVSALFMALLAGEALESAAREKRRAAALALVALVCVALVPRTVAKPGIALDPPDELVSATEKPPEILSDESTTIAGWIRAEVQCDALRLRAEPMATASRNGAVARSIAVELDSADSAGKRAFRTGAIRMSQLRAGPWRFTLEILRRGPGSELGVAGTRVVAASTVAPLPWVTPGSAVLALFSFLVVLFAAGSRRIFAWLAVALALLHVQAFQQGFHLPSVPRGQHFHTTETEVILAEDVTRSITKSVQPAQRIFAGPGVLPGNTALLGGLATIGGFDGLGAASFDRVRAAASNGGASRAGADPALDWNASDIDARSPTFRALAVSKIARLDRADIPGFELEAGPSADAPRQAEVYVYRAMHPLPRARCIAQAEWTDRPSAALRMFDPERESYTDEWRPKTPFTHATVERLEIHDAHVSATVELDGDGLFVLADQAFPGWNAYVDGHKSELLTVDVMFRAVPLGKGSHTVELRYEPESVRIGAWIGIAAFVALWILALVPPRSA